MLPTEAKPIKDHRPHTIGWHEVSEGLMKLFTKLKAENPGTRRSPEDERRSADAPRAFFSYTTYRNKADMSSGMW